MNNLMELVNAIQNQMSSVRPMEECQNAEVKNAMRIIAREVLLKNSDPMVRSLANNEVCVEMFTQPLAVYLSKLELKVIRDPFGNPIGLCGND